MPSTSILRQVETVISFADLRAHTNNKQPLKLEIGPIPNSQGDTEIQTSTITVILDDEVDQGAWVEFSGRVEGTGSPVTIAWRDITPQDITIEFPTNS